MKIYLWYRANTAGPAGKHLTVVEAESILELIQRTWPVGIEIDEAGEWEEEIERRGKALLGPGFACGLMGLHCYAVEKALKAPKDLHETCWLLESSGVTHAIQWAGPLTILATDDVYEMALYLFDEDYAAHNQDKVAWMLREEWQLPDGSANGVVRPIVNCAEESEFDGEGFTVAILLLSEDHYGLSNLEYSGFSVEVSGVRLPDFPRHLFTVLELDDEAFEGHWSVTRQLSLGLRHWEANLTGEERSFIEARREDPRDRLGWGVYSDWTQERDLGTAGIRVLTEVLSRCPASPWSDPGKEEGAIVRCGEHVAQACRKSDLRCNGDPEAYTHIILFDDLWAAAHPDLATSIMRFAHSWDGVFEE